MRLNLSPLGIMNFFFMLGLSFVLTFENGLFADGYTDVRMYRFFLEVSPQEGYGVAAFLTAAIFFLAFLLKSYKLEVLGLGVSGLFLIFILSGYLLTFPNIGSVALFVWTLATFMTIVEILYRVEDEKKQKERVLYEIERLAEKKQIAIESDISYNERESIERRMMARQAYELRKLAVLEEEAERLRKELLEEGEG